MADQQVEIYGLAGPVAVGKGTVLGELKADYGDDVVIIGVGNILRQEIKNGTELGAIAKGFMDQAMLVPSELINEMVLNRIYEIQKEGKASKVILDGYPRNIEQANAVVSSSISLERVIELTLPDETLVERGSDRECCESCGETYTIKNLFKRTKVKGVCDVCGGKVSRRSDDEPEKVRKRWESYKNETYPMFDVLRAADIECVSIDNSLSDARERFFEAVGF